MKFASQTDSEIIAQLLAYNFNHLRDSRQAIIETLQALRGAYAVAIMSKHEPNTLFGAKMSGPLILGIGNNQTYFLSSDNLALVDHAQQIILLEDNELVEINEQGYKITHLKDQTTITRAKEILDLTKEDNKLKGFDDYMSKEIYHSPKAIKDAILGRLNLEKNMIVLGGLDSVNPQLQYINRIIIVACGTSYFAGMVGEYLIEDIAKIPVEVQLASEFKYKQQPLSRSTAVIFISQSGETADTIGAINLIKNSGLLKIGIINTVGSTISKLTDAGVYCRAGIEKSVASTKAFISQVTILILIALYLRKNELDYSHIAQELSNLPSVLEKF